MADEKDLAFAEGLENLGVKKNVAKLITYLKEINESSSRDIELATGLRQPEVSITMRTLRENGWITEREIKRNGKGRPQKIYALRITLDEIIKHYEEEKMHESTRIREAI